MMSIERKIDQFLLDRGEEVYWHLVELVLKTGEHRVPFVDRRGQLHYYNWLKLWHHLPKYAVTSEIMSDFPDSYTLVYESDQIPGFKFGRYISSDRRREPLREMIKLVSRYRRDPHFQLSHFLTQTVPVEQLTIEMSDSGCEQSRQVLDRESESGLPELVVCYRRPDLDLELTAVVVHRITPEMWVDELFASLEQMIGERRDICRRLEECEKVPLLRYTENTTEVIDTELTTLPDEIAEVYRRTRWERRNQPFTVYPEIYVLEIEAVGRLHHRITSCSLMPMMICHRDQRVESCERCHHSTHSVDSQIDEEYRRYFSDRVDYCENCCIYYSVR